MALLAKFIVVYESKYGNTRLVAEAIIDGMREVAGVETVLSELKEVGRNKLTKCKEFGTKIAIRLKDHA